MTNFEKHELQSAAYLFGCLAILVLVVWAC